MMALHLMDWIGNLRSQLSLSLKCTQHLYTPYSTGPWLHTVKKQWLMKVILVNEFHFTAQGHTCGLLLTPTVEQCFIKIPWLDHMQPTCSCPIPEFSSLGELGLQPQNQKLFDNSPELSSWTGRTCTYERSDFVTPVSDAWSDLCLCFPAIEYN